MTRFELSKLKFAADKSRNQQAKVASLDEQIKPALVQAKDDSTVLSEEDEEIIDNELKLGSIIQGLCDFVEAVEEAVEAASIPVQPVNGTQAALQPFGLKLPKISLPSFSGNWSDWIRFSDLFESTVHSNRTLSNIQKLHYLKTSLKEEPARLSQLQLSNADYEVALKILEDQYGNKRMITHTHLERILDFKPLKQDSPQQLRKLLITFVENTIALEAMGHDVNSSDFVWVHVIANKLDRASRTEWELHHGGDDVETMDSMKKFLEERARALEFSTISSDKTAVKTPRDKEKKSNWIVIALMGWKAAKTVPLNMDCMLVSNSRHSAFRLLVWCYTVTNGSG